jgi:hypothetical protein
MEGVENIVISGAFDDLTAELYLIALLYSLWQLLIGVNYYVGYLRIPILGRIHSYQDSHFTRRY